MVETASVMLPLGTKAPNFELIDVISDKVLNLQQLRGEVATVVMFICNHCPYVKLIQDKLVEVANHYQPLHIQFVAINSNDTVAYPQDSPKQMKIEAQQHQYPFPYLFDETQAVAKAFHAACTPDFFVFDKGLLCVYRGRFDEATPGNGKAVTGKDLSTCLDNLLANRAVNPNQYHSLGCSIKWKKT